MMKKLTKNFCISSLILCSLFYQSIPAISKRIEKSSPLCFNSKLITEIGISTKAFNTAICSSWNSQEFKYYYVGESKKTGEKIILPINQRYKPNSSSIVYKAINGKYTYQIFAICYPFIQEKNWASLSVFKNGKKIRHDKVTDYITDSAWCNDLFDQGD